MHCNVLQYTLIHYNALLCTTMHFIALQCTVMYCNADRCDNGKFMHKLKALGIKARLGRWLYNILSQRKQQVVVNGVSTSVTNVTSGVQQGTV